MSVHSHAPMQLTPDQVMPPPAVGLMRKRWMGVAGLFALGSLLLFLYTARSFAGRQEFLRAYLVGFLFCCGLTFGSMAILMLHHVVGGKWGLVLRRMLEAATRTWFVTVLMFVPIAFGLGTLYPWMNGDALDIHGQHVLQLRHAYLNPHAFLARAAFYFMAWGVFIYFLNKWSLYQDSPPVSADAYNRLRLRFMRLGGGGLVFYALSITLAAVDWVMSLDPIWFSTIWGMLYMVAQILTAMAFMLVVLAQLVKYDPMRSLLRKTELHDNGNLLLAFVMLYTYLSFSQFIIIWSGNLPEEIRWYLARTQHGWKPVMIFLVLVHFVAPFLLLLNRGLKKKSSSLGAIALLILCARVGEIYWQVLPNFADASGITGHFHVTLPDIIVPVALIAIWVTMFFYQLGRRPLIPVYHHLLPQILEKSHGTH